MANRKRRSDPGDSGLKEALLQELASLDLSLEELAEREARIHDELEAVQRERKRHQELREHARALLAPREQAQGPASSSRPSLSTTMVDRAEAMEMPDIYLDERRPNTSDTLAKAVYETLKETEPAPGEPGEPMHYRDLVAALESRKSAGSRHPYIRRSILQAASKRSNRRPSRLTQSQQAGDPPVTNCRIPMVRRRT